MGLTADAIRGDLEGLFPEIFTDPTHQPFLEDYVKIGVFLSGLNNSLTSGLDTLEKRMQDRMFKNLGYKDSRVGQQLIDARRDYYIRTAKPHETGAHTPIPQSRNWGVRPPPFQNVPVLKS